LQMRWPGVLSKGVLAKDMMLHMLGKLGMNGGRYQAVEFVGTAVERLNMQERMTLANMSAELGAQVGLIAADDTTAAYLRSVGVSESALHDYPSWRSDDGADCEVYEFDAGALSPQVAAPHSPANTRDVSHYQDVTIDVAYIGACTGAKLEDLRCAAQVLRGHHVAYGVQLMVAPASARDQAQAEKEGVMQILRDAGAKILANSCGACAGYGNALPAGANVISSTARNFKGRMGPASTQVFLGSPYTVAASALRGKISDVREML
jgi:3-isopropylmalate/(R)-2-methylmalate dehydratase large subunit